MKSFTSHALAAIIGAAIVAAACAYYNLRQSLPSILAQPAKELKGEVTAKLTCKPILVYRDKVAEKLGIAAKTGEHVTASTKLPGDDRPRTVSALYDETSGGTRLLERRDPLMWLDTRQRFGAGYSPFVFGSEHDKATQAFDVYWQPIKMKWVDLRLAAEATADGQWTGRARFGVTW